MVRYLAAALLAFLLPAAALAQSSIEPGAVMGRPSSMAKGPSTGVGGILGGVDGTLDLKPPTGLARAINSTQNLSGTAAADVFVNQVYIATDALVAPVHNLYGFGAHWQCCTPAAQGLRFAIGGVVDVDTAWSADDPEAVFDGGMLVARATVTAPSAGAYLGGGNANAQLSAGANGWGTIMGFEADTQVAAGVSAPQVKIGFGIVQGAADAVPGAGLDYGLNFASAGTAPAWRTLINIDSQFGAQSIATNGTVIGMRGPSTFYRGIDFTAATMTDNIITGPSGASVFGRRGGIRGNADELAAGAYPPSTVTGYGISSGFSGGEVSIWNTANAGQGFYFRQKSGASAAITAGAFFNDAGGVGDTVLNIYVNSNAGKNTAHVTLGAADTGGAGFRVLRVPN
jgi:hypothetical protein